MAQLKRIRIGNDFDIVWTILLNVKGEEVIPDLHLVDNLRLTVIRYGSNNGANITDYEIVNNIITLHIDHSKIPNIGKYYVVLDYDKSNPLLEDGFQHFRVDAPVFEIVKSSSQADIGYLIDPVSHIYAGVDGINGLSAYEIAVKYGYVGTEEEWIQSVSIPVTEAVEGLNELKAEFIASELVRNTNETGRIDTESIRVINESNRQSKETIRIDNELDRVDKESSREASELVRIDNESDRLIAELDRVDKESIRVINENDRIDNESTRNISENTRLLNETSRLTVESNRVIAENTRTSNESTRLISETGRVNAELGRVSQDNTRNTLLNNAIDEIPDLVEVAVADAIVKPLSVSGVETKAGSYNFGGDSLNIYEKTIKLDTLPLVLNEVKEYIIADEPLGYGLYFDVAALVASTGKSLNAQFFNSSYELSKCFVNESAQTVIEITCKKNVSVSVNGLLHIQYCKFYGDVVEFDVAVPSGITKENITLEIPKLKYNKKMAFSYITDDSNSIYQYQFCGINKRYVVTDYPNGRGGQFIVHLNTVVPNTATGYYPTKFLQCSDGAGIKHRYATTVATWPNKLKDKTIGQDVGYQWPWISEKEFKLFRDFGFMLGYHDLVGDAAPVNQADFDMQLTNTITLFNNYVGITPKVMIEPNGDHRFIGYSQNNDIIQAITAQSGDSRIKTVYPYKTDFTLDKDDVTVQRIFAYGTLNHNSDETAQYPADILNKLATYNSATDKTTIPWLIGAAHASSKWELDMMDAMHTLYGDTGNDSLWFPTIDEMYEYWYMRMNTTSFKTITDTGVHYKLYVPKGANFFYRDLSVMLNGIDSISGVTVSSGDNVNGTSYAINDNKLLINLNFDEQLLQRAEKHTLLFEANPTAEYLYDNALYFVQMLKDGVREPYMTRLNTFTSPPTLSSFNISGETTQSNIVSLSLSYTGQAPTQYMASESSDFTGANWSTYTNNPSFTLSSSFGVKTIYVKLRNSFGESNILSDTITYLEPTLTLNNFSINSGNTQTSNNIVTLGFTYTGFPTYYMASESSTFVGAEWIAYTSNPSFTLSTGYGNKTIYVKLKNATTETSSLNDSIELIDTVTATLNSIVINNGDTNSSSNVFSVAINYVNTINKYKIGESSTSLGEWIAFTSSPISYTSVATTGLVTLYVQVGNDTTESEIKNDSITIIQPVVLTSMSLNNGVDSFEGLTVPVSFNVSSGTATHYRLAESTSELSSKEWIAMSDNLSYNFASIGSKTLYAQVKNQVGESSVVSDSILIKEPPVTIVLSPTPTTLTNNTISYVDDGFGNIINRVKWIDYGSYGRKQLKSKTGVLLDCYLELNRTDFYQANSLTTVVGCGLGALTQFFPALTGNAGPYPDEFINVSYTGHGTPNSGAAKGRLVFTLPIGRYKFKLLMSVSSGAALSETGVNARSGCYYAIYTDTTELAKTVVGPSGFTGTNNTTFNAELTFDVTEAFDGNVALYAWNSSTGGYRPGLNLIEITKL